MDYQDNKSWNSLYLITQEKYGQSDDVTQQFISEFFFYKSGTQWVTMIRPRKDRINKRL